MSFDALRPYLPYPIVALTYVKTMYGIRGELNKDQLEVYNCSKRILLNTALAVVGYVSAAKFAGRFGLDMKTVAVLALVANGPLARLAIGGHFVVTGVLGAVAAGRGHDAKACAQFAALAAFGYVTNTPGYNEFLNTFIYSKL